MNIFFITDLFVNLSFVQTLDFFPPKVTVTIQAPERSVRATVLEIVKQEHWNDCASSHERDAGAHSPHWKNYKELLTWYSRWRSEVCLPARWPHQKSLSSFSPPCASFLYRCTQTRSINVTELRGVYLCIRTECTTADVDSIKSLTLTQSWRDCWLWGKVSFRCWPIDAKQHPSRPLWEWIYL